MTLGIENTLSFLAFLTAQVATFPSTAYPVKPSDSP